MTDYPPRPKDMKEVDWLGSRPPARMAAKRQMKSAGIWPKWWRRFDPRWYLKPRRKRKRWGA